MRRPTNADCYLRHLSDTDADALIQCFSDPDVVRYTEHKPFTSESATGFLAWATSTYQQDPRYAFVFAICLPPDDHAIGCASLTIRNPGLREGDIGFMIGKPYWRRGYGTAVAAALLALGFEELNLHRIIARSDPLNIGSQRVLRKIGMQLEGQMRECVYEKGEWRDRLLYSRLDHEYTAQVGVHPTGLS